LSDESVYVELFDALWPKASVQPEALKSCIAAIRAVLGDDARLRIFIETLGATIP